jgi:DHA1 family inner membrane transport protein
LPGRTLGREVVANSKGRPLTQITPNRWVLPILCLISFTTLFNQRGLSPILVDISREFDVSIAFAGSLGAAYSLPAAFLSLVFGPLSDRYGRRAPMLSGLCILSVTSLGATFAPNFPLLFAFRILAGLGAAAVIPANFASFGDYFPYSERGRAMAWQVGVTTIAIVAGVPLGSVLAGLLSWRWMFGLLTFFFILSTLLAVLYIPKVSISRKEQGSGLTHYRNSFLQVLRNRSAIAALLSTCLFAMFWRGWTTYNGAFYIQTFELPTEAVAPVFTLQGLALFSASLIGGRLTSRMSKKNLAAISLFICSGFIAIITNFKGFLWISIAMHSIMAIPVGLRILATNTLYTELVPTARGTMMSMNNSAMEGGTMLGVTIGGLIIDVTGGYSWLGFAYGLMAFLAGTILYFFVVEIKEAGSQENK